MTVVVVTVVVVGAKAKWDPCKKRMRLLEINVCDCLVLVVLKKACAPARAWSKRSARDRNVSAYGV